MSTEIQIIKVHLTAAGFDGLCGDGCGCKLPNLAPCGEEWVDCQPAYVGSSARPGEWAMYASKKAAEASLKERGKP